MRVLVFGTFDRLHPGHKYFLSEAEKRGKLFVSVALGKTVAKIKGKKPRQNQEVRVRAIREASPSAEVSLGSESDYLKPVRDISPDLILLGYDQNLPPGISMEDLNCEIERLGAFEPEKYKSSLIDG